MFNKRDLRPALLLGVAVAILLAWGLLTVFSTSSAEVIDRSQMKSTHAALLKQTMFVGAGVLLSLACWRGQMKLVRRSPWILWSLMVVLLLCCWVPGLGISANGAHRWVRFFGQPSELVKVFLPFLLLAWCSPQQITSWAGFLGRMARFMVPILLVLLEPDNGSAVILLFEVGLFLFLIKMPGRYWALPMGILCLVGGLFAWQMPHVHRRLEVYLHPERDLQGKGHQPYQSRIAVGSGGLWGRGLGHGMQKLEYLPEAQNDYIAAIVGEELGFFGILGLMACYATILLCGIWGALRHSSLELRALTMSLTSLLVIQACLNLGVVSGVVPSTGINLPLFSQGGSSLLCNLALIGWLLHLIAPFRPQSSPSQEMLEARRGVFRAFSRIHWQEKPKTLA